MLISVLLARCPHLVSFLQQLNPTSIGVVEAHFLGLLYKPLQRWHKYLCGWHVSMLLQTLCPQAINTGEFVRELDIRTQEEPNCSWRASLALEAHLGQVCHSSPLHIHLHPATVASGGTDVALDLSLTPRTGSSAYVCDVADEQPVSAGNALSIRDVWAVKGEWEA